MVRINLLPWRANIQAQRRRQFVRLLFLGLVITMLMVLYGYWHNVRILTAQGLNNQYLRTQIAQLAEPMQEVQQLMQQRQQLLAYQKTVYDLQIQRMQSVRLLNELASTLPKSVYLEEMTQQGSHIVLRGQAASDASVSEYLRRLATSPWLQNPHLKMMEQASEIVHAGTQHFRLTLQQTFVPAVYATEP